MKIGFVIIFLLCAYAAFSQQQACPININFSQGTLTHWFAYTGNNQNGNGTSAIRQTYDSTAPAPDGTLGTTAIAEYNLPGVSGIRTIINAGSDPFGGFSTVPTINGYQYNYSILLGSTSVSSGGGAKGGYIRGISYEINVPPSSNNEPYTMTYAYAMVLENGSHNSSQQPLASATVSVNGQVISCASNSYYLPTLNNTSNGTTGATLDTAAAIRNGFTHSNTPSPHPVNNGSQFSIWTKDWTEVTFDLSPYRGQRITLTFEADNCVPGGHFAYAYFALRNQCNGLTITGDSLACSNNSLTYAIPSLAGANYTWQIPPSWKFNSDSTINIIKVIPGNNNGYIIAQEQNSCANLMDTLFVNVTTPTIPGVVSGDNTVCAASNSSKLSLSGNTGNVLKWQSSIDGISWTDLNDTTNTYTAINLKKTSRFIAIVQNGKACAIDSSSGATITVDATSVGGSINPKNIAICQGQNKGAILTLSNYTGNILNWQSSLDSITWNSFNPVKTDSLYNISGVNDPTYFRAVLKNGICPADTSSIAFAGIYHVAFPQAIVYPLDTTICFGTAAFLNPIITTGTNYTWNNAGQLYHPGNGTVNTTPYNINAKAAPSKATDYILTITNAGCPNPLIDTMHVRVNEPIVVNAGNDTSVISNQPLQLTATVNDSLATNFIWTPSTGLNFSNISNPIATLNSSFDSITYTVKASTPIGCYGQNAVTIKVFKTGPDIFVPSAFTPNGDGRNDVLKPIPVGIKTFDYFKVFNRWGQLVYVTGEVGKGWDGNVNGTRQQSGTYVYVTQGIDYTGKIIFRKGTVVLIR